MKGLLKNERCPIHKRRDCCGRQAAKDRPLKGVRGKVLISGYASDLYDRELYPDWLRLEREHLADGAQKRTEIVWMNYQPNQAGLFAQAGAEMETTT